MSALWKFADMFGAFVHGFEQTAQPFGEGHITNTAPKATGLLEIRLGESTHRAFLGWRALLDFFRGADAQEQIREGESGRVLDAFLLRAGIAKVHLLHLPFE